VRFTAAPCRDAGWSWLAAHQQATSLYSTATLWIEELGAWWWGDASKGAQPVVHVLLLGLLAADGGQHGRLLSYISGQAQWFAGTMGGWAVQQHAGVLP
jgi:hypothetical protein